MSLTSENKPCLVKAGQGFSVEYKNRLLYSKYAPEKSILQAVDNLEILSGTLILCISPVLGLGLDHLAEKLPENCAMFGIEADKTLFDFSREYCEKLNCYKNGIFSLIEIKDLPVLGEFLNSRLSKWRGVFKRVIKIDFSAASTFNRDFYENFYEVMQNSIAQYWKNRITLVKFGRRYSHNFFENLCEMAKSETNGTIEELFGKIEKPILVLGSGQGLEDTLFLDKENLSQFFIVTVDASLSALKAKNIHVDAVVCEESQSVIAQAFIGCEKYADFAIISLSSCPRAPKFGGKRCLFYATLFDDLDFIENAKNLGILPPILPPLGSVGLTATLLALKFRKNESVKVITCGLDFSFEQGKTHSRGTFPQIKNHSASNRLHRVENYSASFGEGTFFTTDKNGCKTISTTALSGYCEIFKKYFFGVKNLFDGAKTGLELELPKIELEDIENSANEISNAPCSTQNKTNPEQKKRIYEYLENEKNALCELKDILSGKTPLPENERNEKIKNLLFQKEYLFFHFPDGTLPRLEADFLKRVRAEIDGFLKIL